MCAPGWECLPPTPTPGATGDPPHPTGHVCPPAPTWSQGRRTGLRSLPPSPWLHLWGCRPCLQDWPRKRVPLWVGLPVTGGPEGSRLSSQVSGVTHTLPKSWSLPGGLFKGDGSGLPKGAGLGPGLGCCFLSVGNTFTPLKSRSASEPPVPAHGPPGGPTARLPLSHAGVLGPALGGGPSPPGCVKQRPRQ